MKHVRDDIVDSVVFHKNMKQPHWLKLPNCNVTKNKVQHDISNIVRRAQSLISAPISDNICIHVKNIES